MELTQEELRNLAVFVEVGARKIAENSPLDQGSVALSEAKRILDKLNPPQNKDTEE